MQQNKSFILGLEIGIEKLERVLRLFNGYPQNKMSILDVKEQLEKELKLLKGTLEKHSI
jgi:hypothetical protein